MNRLRCIGNSQDLSEPSRKGGVCGFANEDERLKDIVAIEPRAVSETDSRIVCVTKTFSAISISALYGAQR